MMAPPGPSALPPPLGTKSGVSWANIVKAGEKRDASETPMHLQRTHFEKLKSISRSWVTIDEVSWSSARGSMQSSLYGKFLGKSLPLDQAKLALADVWRGLGSFTIADLPNGFYYIRCETQEMHNRLLWEGPWTVARRILQLSPWRESFQPAFEKLTVAAVWIQLYHLPIELWNGDILEMVAFQFGKVLKIDEHTLDCSRAKFARVCVELDLSQPLQQGTWVKYGEFAVFVLVLYEKLPVFCYKCGRVGHGETACPTSGSHLNSGHQPVSVPSATEAMDAGLEMQIDEATGGQPADAPSVQNTAEEKDYGPWLKPRYLRGATRGRGPGRGFGRTPGTGTRPAGEAFKPSKGATTSSEPGHVAATLPQTAPRGQ
ncbi:putative transcription factor interactor and regulator CCHC(Zn) family [Dioscorea sansibarensis]